MFGIRATYPVTICVVLEIFVAGDCKILKNVSSQIYVANTFFMSYVVNDLIPVFTNKWPLFNSTNTSKICRFC